jgi:hypothetical protein
MASNNFLSKESKGFRPELPDGMFSNQNPIFGKLWRALE